MVRPRLTCSKTENLIAYSGAILSTFMPLPRQSERMPPSWTRLRSPLSRFLKLLLEEYTWRERRVSSPESPPGVPPQARYLTGFLGGGFTLTTPPNPH